MTDFEKIESEFNRIKSLGFVKSHRTNNTGIGKTFEDLLGVDENNKKDHDFIGFEVKSQRFLSGSKITLFTKSPSYPSNANSLLLNNYGNLDTSTGLKRIHTSFYGDRFNKYLSKYSFKLTVNRGKRKVFIDSMDLMTNIVTEGICYYSFKDLKLSIQKLNKLFVVTADTRIIDGEEYFHYTKAEVFLNFSFAKFIDMIAEAKIQYDVRIGSYKSGTNFGKPHDHGSGFRISRKNLNLLYKKHYLLK